MGLKRDKILTTLTLSGVLLCLSKFILAALLEN